MTGARGHEEGFSLVEILVAFAVLAGALVIGLRIFGDGLGRISGERDQLTVLRVLRHQLTEHSGPSQLIAGETRGTTDGVAWIVRIGPTGSSDAQAPYSLAPWKVQVAEDRPDDTGRVLDTVVLGPKTQ